MGWISRARRIPGSNLLLKTAGAGVPTLSPRRLLPLTNDRLPAMRLGFRLHPIPRSRARGRGKAVSLSLLHLSERCSTATALPKTGQDASQLGWSRQTRASSCWRPDPPLAWKHAQNPPAQHCADLGFPPGGFVQLLGAGSSEAFTPGPGAEEEEEEEGGRCRHWGAGITAKRKEPAPSSGRHLRSPAPSRQKLHVPASRGPPPAVQDGERHPRAGGHPRREGGHRCGEAAWFLLRLHGLVLRAGICSKMGFLSCFVWFCFVLNDSISPLNLHL